MMGLCMENARCQIMTLGILEDLLDPNFWYEECQCFSRPCLKAEKMLSPTHPLDLISWPTIQSIDPQQLAEADSAAC